MPTAQQVQCHAILSAAASAAIGLVLKTNNPAKARQVLYNFRTQFPDPSFADLTVRVSPDDSETELWILRKATAGNPTISFADVL